MRETSLRCDRDRSPRLLSLRRRHGHAPRSRSIPAARVLSVAMAFADIEASDRIGALTHPEWLALLLVHIEGTSVEVDAGTGLGERCAGRLGGPGGAFWLMR